MTGNPTAIPVETGTGASESARADSGKASAVFALVLGLGVLFAAGFAEADLLHAAAHDSRHAFTFPCH